ncbi:hypothetical protein GW17_00055014, partial [Ensete ventricosum]
SFYSGRCGLFVPDDLTAFMIHHVAAPHTLPPYWWGSVRLQVGVADLTCARSVVRHLVPSVHPVDRSRRFGRVRGLAVPSKKAMAACSSAAAVLPTCDLRRSSVSLRSSTLSAFGPLRVPRLHRIATGTRRLSALPQRRVLPRVIRPTPFPDPSYGSICFVDD